METVGRSNINFKTNLQNLANLSGFSLEFAEPSDDLLKPMFITEFPFANEQGLTIFDYYYNLNNN